MKFIIPNNQFAEVSAAFAAALPNPNGLAPEEFVTECLSEYVRQVMRIAEECPHTPAPKPKLVDRKAFRLTTDRTA